MKWAADRMYSVSFGAAFLLLVTIGGISYIGMLRSRLSTRQTRQTQEALKQLENALARVKDAETGQRGYLLTGNKHYLQPYETAISTLDADIFQLRKIAIQHPTETEDITKFSHLLKQKETELAAVIHLRQTQGFEAAVSKVKTNQGNEMMDQIRQASSRLDNAERSRLDENIRDEDTADDQTTFFIIGGVLVEGLMLSGLFFKLNQFYQSAQAQVQELERLNQLKDDFLSTVSHELRSPMTSIKMATQMLDISLNHLGLLDDESSTISRYVKILQEEGQREINLINDLLDLTRLESGTEPLTLNTIAFQVYIPHLLEAFSERTRQQRQQLVVQIPDSLPAYITDVSYLERILTELLHNACKYTPEGEKIEVMVQPTSEMLVICISNSGVEIAAAEHDRIFDKFYRIPNSDPWKHGGTGLGLTLVKKLTMRLGGKIRVESGSGQTVFILELKESLQRFEKATLML